MYGYTHTHIHIHPHILEGRSKAEVKQNKLKEKHRALNYTIKGLIYVKGKTKRILNNLANIPKRLSAKKIIQNNDEKKSEMSKLI